MSNEQKGEDMRPSVILGIVAATALALATGIASQVPASSPGADDSSVPSFIEDGKRYVLIGSENGILTVTGIDTGGWVIADYETHDFGNTYLKEQGCRWHPVSKVIICPWEEKPKKKKMKS